jgi:hypothetical protein
VRNRPFAFGAVVSAVVLSACGGGDPGPADPTPALTNEWRFTAEHHVALWYHGLALANVGASTAAPIPYYRTGYAAEAQAARRSGTSPLPALSSRLASANVDAGLQFLPLYFDSWQQMRQAIDVWQQAGGDPARAGDAQTQAIIAFLSQRFSTATQRAAVVEFVNALEQERTAFFDTWWNQTQPTSLAQEAEALWRSYQPQLRSFLRYSDAEGGHVALTPALRGEGRAESGRGVAVAAIGGRSGEDARVIVGRAIHELAYSLAAEAVRDAVAPARIREIGEDVLVARAAVRAGAMIIERTVPDLLPAYRDDYIRAAGGDPARLTLVQQFDLPNELVPALESAVQLATAGI